MKRLGSVMGVMAILLAGCAFGPARVTRLERTEPVSLLVVDEHGDPVGDATFRETSDDTHESNPDGIVELDLSQPVAGVITAPGMVPEPIAISPRDRQMSVTMLDRIGPNGERTVLHFGGDTMLGRRYQVPKNQGTSEAAGAKAARAVVSDLAPLAAAADATTVNSETVIGELDNDLAYPGKRFLLQSPPYILDMFDAMGVDLVTLGNNHANDWRDQGIASTIEVLDAAGMPHVGAGLNPDEAIRGQIIAAGTRKLGVVSATTVNGAYVNDQLPTASNERPASTPEAEAWQYEQRGFGFGHEGEPGYLALAPRRAGDAWREFKRLEPTLNADRVAAFWKQLTADNAFPELQDWVAGRGHGGAAAYDRVAVRGEIERLRSNGADLVVVQFHGGFQFAEVKSAFIRRISRATIDDGADFVISHHPHVLEGVEWYKGRLIAYSLGNLVFDQDFLSTFPTAMLRVVVDDAGLVEARVIPVMLVGYRPVPVAGDAAERIVRMLEVRSALPAESERIVDFAVGGVLRTDRTNGVTPATVTFTRNSGLITTNRPERLAELTVDPDQPAALPPCLLTRAEQLPDGVQYATDLFDWGSFNDVTADRNRGGTPMHWVVPDRTDDWAITQGESPDPLDDALALLTNANREVSTRFVARVGIVPHRLFDTDDGHSVDAPASYSIEMDVRRIRGESAFMRIDLFHVDDADPTRDPVSTKLRSVELPIVVPENGEWNRVALPVDDKYFEPVDGQSVGAAMMTITVAPAFRGRFELDNVRVLEWRAAPTTDLPVWVEADFVRSDQHRSVEITTTGCESD